MAPLSLRVATVPASWALAAQAQPAATALMADPVTRAWVCRAPMVLMALVQVPRPVAAWLTRSLKDAGSRPRVCRATPLRRTLLVRPVLPAKARVWTRLVVRLIWPAVLMLIVRRVRIVSCRSATAMVWTLLQAPCRSRRRATRLRTSRRWPRAPRVLRQSDTALWPWVAVLPETAPARQSPAARHWSTVVRPLLRVSAPSRLRPMLVVPRWTSPTTPTPSGRRRLRASRLPVVLWPTPRARHRPRAVRARLPSPAEPRRRSLARRTPRPVRPRPSRSRAALARAALAHRASLRLGATSHQRAASLRLDPVAGRRLRLRLRRSRLPVATVAVSVARTVVATPPGRVGPVVARDRRATGSRLRLRLRRSRRLAATRAIGRATPRRHVTGCARRLTVSATRARSARSATASGSDPQAVTAGDTGS